MTLLPARPTQATELSHIAITAKRHWGYPERWIQLWKPQLTVSPKYVATHEVWLAVCKGETAGFYSLENNHGVTWLEHLWVLPKFMGQGIGRQLFLHAVTHCRKLGYKTIQIESDPNAQGFYEHMGAHQIGEHVGELDGHPRILPVMEISL